MTQIYLFTFQKLGTDQGIKTYINELSQALDLISDYRVTIVTFYSDSSSPEISVENNIRRINIAMPVQEEGRKLVYYDLKLYNIACSRILEKYVDLNDRNIFHLNYNQHDLLVDHLRKIDPRAKIVFTIHFMRWVTAMDHDLNRFKKLIANQSQTELTPKEFLSVNDFKALKSLCNEIDKVICLSEYTFELLREMYGVPEEKVSLLKNGLSDNTQISSKITSIIQRKWLTGRNCPKVMIYSGRIEENKGMHLLLQALKTVIMEFDDAILIVAGKGDYDKFFDMANQLLGNIYFTGELPSVELDSIYKLADIGIHPSLNEQCSFSVLEMMRNGLPVIGYDLSGMSCLINQNFNGTKVGVNKNVTVSKQQPEMIENLANAIIKYLRNPSLITEEGKNGRLLFESTFSKEIFSERMKEFYNSLLLN